MPPSDSDNASPVPVSVRPVSWRPVSWKTAACGLAMGAADIVPGVSGGTVALILGVYERLLTAISRFDGTFVGHVVRREWRDAARRVDLGFLLLIGGGILASVIGMAGLMEHLLSHHRAFTYAAFFGLILASGVLVGRMARPTSAAQTGLCLLLGAIAAGTAFWLVTLSHVTPMPGLGYTFVCGAIAICAMVLPGVSGAYLLLMLGKYEEITGILKRLPRLQVTTDDLLTVGVFCVGCLVGLILFSKLLHWLLARYWTPTMAVLCGFMVGSLYRVWPLQTDTTPAVEEFKKKVFQPIWPETWTSEVGACLAIAAACFVAVLVIDKIASRSAKP